MLGHDPFCRVSQQDRIPAADCPDCTLIARVRSATREESAQRADWSRD